jgi:hypothetical protein
VAVGGAVERRFGREFGPVLILASGLLLAGAMLVWGLSGAIVVVTLLVVVACVILGKEWVRGELPTTGFSVDSSSVPDRMGTVEPTEASVLPAAPARESPALHLPPLVQRVISSARIESWRQAMTAIAIAVLAVSALVFYLRGIGANPAGLFCDEAEIGLESFRLLHGDAETTTIPVFYHHFGYDLGFLPLVTTAPFVALFGLDDFAVRLAPAVLMLATFVVVYLTLRRLRTPFAFVPVALLAFSPIVIHLSRANFGHAPSILLIAIAFDRYVVARTTRRHRPAIVAGLLFGLSAFGNPAFYVVTPIVLAGICLSEIAYNGRRVREYATIGLILGFTALAIVPLPYRALTDETFWRRFREKNISTAPLFSTDRVGQVIDNYPKYFSKVYLFDVGEVGMPGAFIARHSVRGAGLVSDLVLPIALLGLVSLVLLRSEPLTRFYLPWFVVAVLYPLPDLLTTNRGQAPYTLAVFGSCLCLPFVTGCALRGLEAFGAGTVRLPHFDRVQAVRVRRSWLTTTEEPDEATVTTRPWLLPAVAIAVYGIVTISGWRFYTGPYQDYPNISADYWGWQFGPKQMIAYYVEHEDEYDEFIMDGNFNEAYVFLDFYIRDPDLRRRASIGDITRLDLTKRQLFGIRSETWRDLPGSQVPPKSYLVIDEVIPYPNGEDGMYLMELR